jgi:hypothetical protein
MTELDDIVRRSLSSFQTEALNGSCPGRRFTLSCTRIESGSVTPEWL